MSPRRQEDTHDIVFKMILESKQRSVPLSGPCQEGNESSCLKRERIQREICLFASDTGNQLKSKVP